MSIKKITQLKFLFLISIIALYFSVSWSQRVDYPKNKEGKDSFNNKVKCDSAIVLSSRLLMQNKIDQAGEVLTEAIGLAESIDYKDALAPLYFHFSRCFEQKKDYKTAAKFAGMGLVNITNKNEAFKSKLLTNLSRYFQRDGNLDSMMAYHQKALEWNKNFDPYRDWVLYEQMAEFYLNLGDNTKVKEVLDKAYAITKAKGDRMDHGVVLYRLRQFASRTGDMAELAKYSKEYYDLTKETGGGKMIHGLDLGSVENADESISNYKQLLNELEKIDFEAAKPSVYARLAIQYLNKKDALNCIRYNLKIDTTNATLKFMEDYHDNLFQAYSMKGEYDKAVSEARKLMTIRDQLREQQKQEQILRLEAKYENEKKETQIALLSSMDEAKTLRIARAEQEKKWLSLSSFIFFLLAAWITVLLFKNKEKNKVLQEKNNIISKALQEKDFLLKEIHHRVKNNLQVVSSLLNLQSNFIKDPIALDAINEGKNRVGSMALIHQNLYTEENLTSIETKKYFEDLIDQLFDSYNIDEEKVTLTKDIDSFWIDVDTMIPLGLITNELISNALKHAFDQEDNGSIHFSIKNEGNTITLMIKDDGKGFKESDFNSTKSFGHKMITAFVNKLKARMHIKSDDGTEISLIVPKTMEANYRA